jgi:solute carrier family 25 phosphate transporter 23/24/25/41
LESIRRKLQTQGVAGRPVQYAGIVDCAAKVVQTSGVRGLYAGLAANLLKAPFNVGIMFLTYEEILKACREVL